MQGLDTEKSKYDIPCPVCKAPNGYHAQKMAINKSLMECARRLASTRDKSKKANSEIKDLKEQINQLKQQVSMYSAGTYKVPLASHVAATQESLARVEGAATMVTPEAAMQALANQAINATAADNLADKYSTWRQHIDQQNNSHSSTLVQNKSDIPTDIDTTTTGEGLSQEADNLPFDLEAESNPIDDFVEDDTSMTDTLSTCTVKRTHVPIDVTSPWLGRLRDRLIHKAPTKHDLYKEFVAVVISKVRPPSVGCY
jgi:hypothetical protein